MRLAYEYIKKNGGIDGEDDYKYYGEDNPCWLNASRRVVATVNSFESIPAGSEDHLAAAVAMGPVSVAIEADQAGFQHYSSGTFDGPCGTNLDHGVLVRGHAESLGYVREMVGSQPAHSFADGRNCPRGIWL